MEKEISKVEQQIECIACQWNKNCIEPPVMTKEEVDAKLKRPAISDDEKSTEKSIAIGLMDVMFFGGKDREAIVCPVFAKVLRSSPELSQKVKSFMKGN